MPEFNENNINENKESGTPWPGENNPYKDENKDYDWDQKIKDGAIDEAKLLDILREKFGEVDFTRRPLPKYKSVIGEVIKISGVEHVTDALIEKLKEEFPKCKIRVSNTDSPDSYQEIYIEYGD